MTPTTCGPSWPNFSHHKARVQAVDWPPIGDRETRRAAFAAPLFMVGRNQPSKEWMWWKRAKNGRKLVKLGENPNIPYPECERSIKIPVVKQQ